MLRWSIAVVVLMPALAVLAFAQNTPESLKGPDRQAFQELKGLKTSVVVAGDEKATATNRALLTKQAKHYVGQLMDPKRIQANDLARAIEDTILDLPIPRGTPIREMDKYLAFGQEMGNAIIAELETALKSSRIVVRVNAARMLSVAAELGCDKAAELALKTLAKPEESDGVKHWALITLVTLFTLEPDSANKDVTVFTHFKSRDLENKCIVALCDYITKPRDVANLSPEEIAAITFVRREAVKALGLVRTPRLKFQGAVLARPALVLLKVANKDGITPEPDLNERLEAIVGFCQLFPVVARNADREVQIDFAANSLGAAILDIVTIKINDPTNIMIPWKFAAHRIDNALLSFAKNVEDMKLNASVPAAMSLHKQIKTDLLEGLKNDRGGAPNTVGFRGWLQNNPAKSQVLFSDEPAATMKNVGN